MRPGKDGQRALLRAAIDHHAARLLVVDEVGKIIVFVCFCFFVIDVLFWGAASIRRRFCGGDGWQDARSASTGRMSCAHHHRARQRAKNPLRV